MDSIIDEIKSIFKKRDMLIKLILINILVFLSLLLLQVSLFMFNASNIFASILDYVALPSDFNKIPFRFWTTVTYFFVHADIFHIFFNLLVMYWFGNVINDLIGEKKVLNLYILGGLVGAVFYILGVNTLPALAAYKSSILIGCSACVYAIVVGAATLSPNYLFHLILLGPVRIKYIALFYVILSFAQTMGNNPGGNLAHLGGALMGYVYISQLRKGNDWGNFIWYLVDVWNYLFSRKPKMKVTHRSASSFNLNQNLPNQDEIDRILDKINLKGYTSLTKEEKEKLNKASQN
ncbi:MAG: rhomboid family intramembrane serine protease [Cytophagales bacterium]